MKPTQITFMTRRFERRPRARRIPRGREAAAELGRLHWLQPETAPQEEKGDHRINAGEDYSETPERRLVVEQRHQGDEKQNEGQVDAPAQSLRIESVDELREADDDDGPAGAGPKLPALIARAGIKDGVDEKPVDRRRDQER
jgi:hypothetical protein